MKAFNGDPASAARRPEALREETRRIRRVQRAVDLALQLIAHGELTRGEALRLMTAVRRYTLDLFPDKGGSSRSRPRPSTSPEMFRPAHRKASDFELRAVQPSDADRIRRILQVAFEDENRRMGLRNIRLPVMRRQLLDFYLDRSPETSFILQGKGGAVGFTLSCRWGSVGWIGPVAVLPPAQGLGLGRRLVEAASEALRQAGVRTIGLETMPRSYRNLQFYLRLGMQVSGMTLDVSRVGTRPGRPARERPDPAPEMVALGRLSGPERSRALEELRRISGRIASGLDYSREALKTAEHGLGETLIARWGGEPVGLAVVHTVPYAEEEVPGTLRVNTCLACPPPGRDDPLPVFEALLAAVEKRLDSEGGALTVRVPARCHRALQTLLARDFYVTHSDIRLTFDGYPERDRPDVLHLSKWE
jgi:predicted N-acetyltransferase YhbS